MGLILLGSGWEVFENLLLFGECCIVSHHPKSFKHQDHVTETERTRKSLAKQGSSSCLPATCPVPGFLGLSHVQGAGGEGQESRHDEQRWSKRAVFSSLYKNQARGDSRLGLQGPIKQKEVISSLFFLVLQAQPSGCSSQISVSTDHYVQVPPDSTSLWNFSHLQSFEEALRLSVEPRATLLLLPLLT